MIFYMARPKGRRTKYRKLTLFPSELDRVLQQCPEGETPIQRVVSCCRGLARGEYRVERIKDAPAWTPPELIEAREQRAPSQPGRTKGARTQRDVNFFAAEWEAFKRAIPRLSFQAFWRSVAAGALKIVSIPEGVKVQDKRLAAGQCALCGRLKEDRGEYCRRCRGVES
jgi:hypothetical protein